MEKLSPQQIQAELATLKGWSSDGQAITRKWQFKDFKQAMAFIRQVADLAEQHNHHPELWNVYNQVELRFTTHDAGGLTARDFAIARAIDQIEIAGKDT
ncbi:MAG: 4a-hydroxytetrahydrobiopterin dehydratase [Calditrichaeota bacterium]|nr:MAG: 4a-hydroxytetrahydrobiopterin dehydratase [Calditrichota bacterium]